MAVSPPLCTFGAPAPDFALPGTDGRIWRLADIAGPRGTLVMFICNHCPYVRSVLDRIIRDARDLLGSGIGVVSISANDPADYPEDAFPEMQRLARDMAFPFPYLFDETQDIARAYGAVCTPDFFGYNAALGLQYRGRLDDSGRHPGAPDARRELYLAMSQIAETGAGPHDQIASIGCSIKWRVT